jgi:hypothetical protein
MVLRERKLSEYLFYWLNIADLIYTRRIAMAELRIHDQSSTFYKSLRSRGTDINVDLNLPDRSGIILTEKELMDILNRESKLNADAIMKPDITETPIDANGFAGPIPIATYKTSETFLGEHDRTEWIASDTSDFHRITDGSSNKIFKTSWYPNLTTSGEQVYVKYRFRSGNIVSPWSDTIAFRGTAQGIITPSITVEENGLEPAIKITPLAYYGTFPGIEHVSTSWVIEDEEGNKVVERPLDTVNKVKLVIEADVLDPKKEYTIYATQHTNVAQPAWAKSKTAIGEYITPKSKVDRPVLRYDDSGDPKVIGSAFSGEGAHLATEWMIYNDLGAKIAEFSYDTIKLTTFPMKDFVSQGRKYRITARYITAESKSPRGSVSIEIPAPSTGDISTVSGMNINPTTENRGMSISVVPFVSPVREDIQYWRYQVRLDISHGSPVTNVHYIHSETDTSQEVEDSWNKALRKDLTPAQSWLAWFPNSEIVNPTISILGTSVRMGLKTEVRNRAQVQSKTFDYVLGNATWEDINTLNPLIKISDSTGADVAWMGYRGTEWTLSKKTGSTPEGNPIWTKVRVENSTDKSKHRLNALETDTEYRVTVVHKTNCFCFAKDYEFRSAAYIMASPVVAMEGSGKKWKIKSSGYSLTNYTGPNGQHGSTSYLVTKKNTGEKVWESLKDTVNKTVANIPESVLELGQEYNVRVIFHSAAGHDSGATTVSFKVPTYRAKFDSIGTTDTITVDEHTYLLFGQYTFSIENFQVIDSETGQAVTNDRLAKVDWTATLNGDRKEKLQNNGNYVSFEFENVDITNKHLNISITAKCYSINGLETEIKYQTYQIWNPYIKTCNTYNFSKLREQGITLGRVTDKCVWSVVPWREPANLKKIDLLPRRYMGTKQDENNLIISKDGKRGHYYAGDFITEEKMKLLNEKGVKYAVNRSEHLNLFSREPELWSEHTFPLKLPTYYELLSKLHISRSASKTDYNIKDKDKKIFWNNFNSYSINTSDTLDRVAPKNIRDFTYYDHEDNKTVIKKYEESDKSNGNVLESPTPHYTQFYSATSKKIGFITNYTMSISWLDILAAHPELVEGDVFTARFGGRLYYVRLPSRDDLATFYNISTYYVTHDETTHYDLTKTNDPKISANGIKELILQPNGKKIKTMSKGEYSKTQFTKRPITVEEEGSVNSVYNCRFVLIPLEEYEAPYHLENLKRKYPNFDFLDLLSKETGQETKTLKDGKIQIFKVTPQSLVLYNDTYGSNHISGPAKYNYDKQMDVGYLGRIHHSLIKSYKNLMEGYGALPKTKLTDGTGTESNDVQWYDVFYYHGTLGLIPNGAPWIGYTFEQLKDLGLLFGCDMGEYSRYCGDILVKSIDKEAYNKIRISGMLLGDRTITYEGEKPISSYPLWLNLEQNDPNHGSFHSSTDYRISEIWKTYNDVKLYSNDMFSELLLKVSKHTDNDTRLNSSVNGATDDEKIKMMHSTYVKGRFFTENNTLTTSGNSSDLKLFNSNGFIGKTLFVTSENSGKYNVASCCYKADPEGTDYEWKSTTVQYGFRPWLRIMPGNADIKIATVSFTLTTTMDQRKVGYFMKDIEYSNWKVMNNVYLKPKSIEAGVIVNDTNDELYYKFYNTSDPMPASTPPTAVGTQFLTHVVGAQENWLTYTANVFDNKEIPSSTPGGSHVRTFGYFNFTLMSDGSDKKVMLYNDLSPLNNEGSSRHEVKVKYKLYINRDTGEVINQERETVLPESTTVGFSLSEGRLEVYEAPGFIIKSIGITCSKNLVNVSPLQSITQYGGLQGDGKYTFAMPNIKLDKNNNEYTRFVYLCRIEYTNGLHTDSYVTYMPAGISYDLGHVPNKAKWAVSLNIDSKNGEVIEARTPESLTGPKGVFYQKLKTKNISINDFYFNMQAYS